MFVAAGNLLDKIDDAPPQLRVTDAHEGLGQGQTVGSGEKIGDISGRGRLTQAVNSRSGAETRRAFEKELNGYLEDMRDLLQSARSDAVGSFLILLNLLKRQAERIAELFLTHS